MMITKLLGYLPLTLFLLSCVAPEAIEENIADISGNKTPKLESIQKVALLDTDPAWSYDFNEVNTGTDFDQDNDPITYTCFYDIAGAFVGESDCSSLNGVSFDTTTGVIGIDPTVITVQGYFFRIVASDGRSSPKTSESVFEVEIDYGTPNTVPDITASNPGNFAATETIAISQLDFSENTTLNDTDVDGDNLTYACVYDTTLDSMVSFTSFCDTGASAIPGLVFDEANGIFDWTPDYTVSGNGFPLSGTVGAYEFKIVAQDGRGGSSEFTFQVAVTNTDQAPELATISGGSVNENSSFNFNANDVHTGTDQDRDTDIISYTCHWDNSIADDTVDDSGSGNACDGATGSPLPGGLTWNPVTGFFDWTPNYDAHDNGPDYEIKITGASSGGSDIEYIDITVNNNNRSPVASTIGNQTCTKGSGANNCSTDVGTISPLGSDPDTSDILTYNCKITSADDGTPANTPCTSAPLSISSAQLALGVFDLGNLPVGEVTSTYIIEIEVTDNHAASDSKTFTLTLNETPLVLDEASSILGTTDPILINNTNNYDFGTVSSFTDKDVENSNVTYECHWKDNTVATTFWIPCDGRNGINAIDPSTGALSVTPEIPGDYHIEITVTNDGDATRSDNNFFILRATGDPGFTQVAAGKNHACAFVGSSANNPLYCWGSNSDGQLGLGAGTASTSNTTRIPTRVGNTGTYYSIVSAGDFHTCAVSSSGTASCWGKNNAGQLGRGSFTLREESPNFVQGGIQFTEIDLGMDSTCGIQSSTGRIFCWGSDNLGKLGNGTTPTTDQNVPIGVYKDSDGNDFVAATSISVGEGHACAIFSGDVYCWGDNFYGQLGIGSNGGGNHRIVATIYSTSNLSGAAPFTRVTVGSDHTCASRPTGGTAGVYCWGSNEKGQIGHPGLASGPGNFLNSPDTSFRVSDSGPTNIAIGGSEKLKSGYDHTCLLTGAIANYCWGDNSFRQIEDDTTAYYNYAHSIAGVLQEGYYAYSFAAGGNFNCGIYNNSGYLIHCWGAANKAQTADPSPTTIPVIHTPPDDPYSLDGSL